MGVPHRVLHACGSFIVTHNSSLDDNVCDVVTTLRLTAQTELSVAKVVLKAEFDPDRNVSVAR